DYYCGSYRSGYILLF
nr:immunoglobulin light chain junction region [Macaca mulatta]MOV97943.1 immunoglobulin light chain junction region [Macaca mulatta]MOV98670.1 immunoglobulin light chain junction region [Macaca mulatta]MOW00448.1 immunoglobulin light chain junction region [Macaca mulatta]MOW00730.1 immunoglobulin light chain junction region [Macaca mulatta]